MAKPTNRYTVQVKFTAWIDVEVEATSLEDAIQSGKDILQGKGQGSLFSDIVSNITDLEDTKVTGVFES